MWWPHGTIEGDRLMLVPLREGMVTEQYVHWLNTPEVVRYTESRFQKHTLESVRAWVKKQAADYNVVLRAIVLKETGQHIGNIKLSMSPQHCHGDIGLLIGEQDQWGKGYATESIHLMRAYGHNCFSLQHIYAGCYALNVGAVKAFEKAGFEWEGTLRRHYRINGQSVDGLLLGACWQWRNLLVQADIPQYRHIQVDEHWVWGQAQKQWVESWKEEGCRKSASW